jgi:SAM-dependent methyltransferase
VKTRKSATKSPSSKPTARTSVRSGAPVRGGTVDRRPALVGARNGAAAPLSRGGSSHRPAAPAPARPGAGPRQNNGPRPSASPVPEIPTTPLGPLAQAMMEAQVPGGQPVPHFPKDDYDYGWIKEFFAKAYAPRTCRAVIFGCGKGESSVYLSQKGFRVTGLDADRVAVGLARERAWLSSCDVDFMIGDIFETSGLLPAESFGLSIDKSVFLSIPGERDRRRFLEAVHRLLLPGGVFLLAATVLDPDRRPAGTTRTNGAAAKPEKGAGRAKAGGRRGKVEESLLVQEGGEVLGEILRAGFQIFERRPERSPAGRLELMVVCRR